MWLHFDSIGSAEADRLDGCGWHCVLNTILSVEESDTVLLLTAAADVL
jgi:hypothetical protein